MSLAHLFLSHTKADDDFVRELREALADFGLEVWTDSRQLKGGDPLWSEVSAAIESAVGLAVLVSLDSLQSRWVGMELQHGLQVQAQRGRAAFPVIPLSFNGTRLGGLEFFFEEEPAYIPMSSGAGGATAAIHHILVAIGRRLPTDRPSMAQPQPEPEPVSEKPGISISIEGTNLVLLGKTACYTVISQNAVRGVWSINGFQNEPINVDPLGPRHQIFIEPTDATRVGETFAIAFTAYDASGKSEIAIKRFKVVSATEAAASLHTSESPRRLSTFLCHSSGDKEAVRQLYEKLKSDGIDPWLDEKNLLPGHDWHEEITRAVRTVDVVIVCLSRESINKRGYVQKEIKNALDVADEQPEGTIFIIPLRLEECELPQRLARWHYVNFFEVDGYKRLMLALQYCAIKKRITLSVDPSEDELMQFYQEKFEEVFAKTFGENHAKLNSKFKGKIVISFTGVSGVGRTSTINALMKHNVAPVDKFIVTTEQVELYQWLNGENKVYIADIPRLEYGMAELNYSDHVQEFLKDKTDVIIFFMSSFQRIGSVELRYLDYFAESDKPKIIAVNMIDRVSFSQLMDYLSFIEDKTGYTPVPISALNNQNIDLLREFLMKVIQLYST